MKALLLLLSKSPFLSSSQSHRFCFSSIFNTTTINYQYFSSSSITKNPNPIFIDYLIETFGLSKTQLDSVSKYFQSHKPPKKVDSVIHLLREFGFSETQIRVAILRSPRILSSDVEETLKPKLSYFQNELGITSTDLGLFISKSPSILFSSLERRLIPNISLLQKELGLTGSDLGHFISKNINLLPTNPELRLIPSINLLKKILVEYKIGNTSDLSKIVQRYSAILTRDPKKSKWLANISTLHSCGIVGDQLLSLLKREPWLFNRKESAVRDLVSKAQEMGFSCDSRMFVHAISTLHKVNSKTLESKFQLLRSFGFSQEECSAIFRSAPNLLVSSERRLTKGMNFFDGAGFERKMLVQNPFCLMYSMEKRVIPRFRVYQILKSKQQVLSTNNKCPSFPAMLFWTEKKFLENYVFKFGDHAEDLLAAYNNGNVVAEQVPSSPSKQNS